MLIKFLKDRTTSHWLIQEKHGRWLYHREKGPAVIYLDGFTYHYIDNNMVASKAKA